jgi:hypothetical protein
MDANTFFLVLRPHEPMKLDKQKIHSSDSPCMQAFYETGSFFMYIFRMTLPADMPSCRRTCCKGAAAAVLFIVQCADIASHVGVHAKLIVVFALPGNGKD